MIVKRLKVIISVSIFFIAFAVSIFGNADRCKKKNRIGFWKDFDDYRECPSRAKTKDSSEVECYDAGAKDWKESKYYLWRYIPGYTVSRKVSGKQVKKYPDIQFQRNFLKFLKVSQKS